MYFSGTLLPGEADRCYYGGELRGFFALQRRAESTPWQSACEAS
jgi:hypothetical protein